jgi:hypothetical protein
MRWPFPGRRSRKPAAAAGRLAGLAAAGGSGVWQDPHLGGMGVPAGGVGTGRPDRPRRCHRRRCARVSPPWFRPVYESSKRRLTWPNGAIAISFTPRRRNGCAVPSTMVQCAMSWVRGHGPRRGTCCNSGCDWAVTPRSLVATTPRPIRLIRELLARCYGHPRLGLREPGEPGTRVLRPDHPQIRRHPAWLARAQRRIARGHARRIMEPRHYRRYAPAHNSTPREDRGRDRSSGELG